MGILNFRSLAFKISLIMLLFSLGVGTFVSYRFADFLKLSLTDTYRQNLQQQAEKVQVQMDWQITELQSAVRRFAKSFQKQIDMVEPQQAWASVGPYLIDVANVTYYVSNSSELFAFPKSWQEQVRRQLDLDNSLFYSVVSDRPNDYPHGKWTPVYLDDELNQWLITYAVPVFKNREFVGVFGGGTDIDDIIKKLLTTDSGIRCKLFFVRPEQQHCLSPRLWRHFVAASRECGGGQQRRADSPVAARIH